jgi:Mg2+-importing ATPase
MASIHAETVDGAEDDYSAPLDMLLARLGASLQGLTWTEARQRLAVASPRLTPIGRRSRGIALLISQFRSPILLLLLAAVALSLALGEPADAIIILAILVVSGLLGFWQEWVAADAMEQLLSLVRPTATVLRDSHPVEIPADEVTVGDVVILNAGDVIPGDGRILEARDLFVAEAALTGETFPVEKSVGARPVGTPVASRTNCLFLGTNVVSGTAMLLVTRTGRRTEFGRISASLAAPATETEFERGIRHFGYLLLEVTLLLLVAIFAINVALHRPILEAFLFAMAISVGLTPQLLPAIISVNLAQGARRMAEARVLVRRPASIENLGSMDILCSDKTGTLTEGKVRVHSAVDPSGEPSDRVKLYAFLNASLQAGYANPIDAAIRAEPHSEASLYRKLDEEPYDFVRKRLSVLVDGKGHRLLISKGAVPNILEVCTSAENASGEAADLRPLRPAIEQLVNTWNATGLRTLGVAYKDVGREEGIDRDSESDMIFAGLLVLDDALRSGVSETITRLTALGVSVRMITGDNRLVAEHVARKAGLPDGDIVTGDDLRQMSDEALHRLAAGTTLFAEVEPNQKARIIRAIRGAGHVVGYLGDGINDASAIHAADVGISVADAVDVAKQAADIVLMEKDLGVLERGVREGRVTFANTMKYVFMATSANFGNMFSMAAASWFLPYLPLLPKQVLLLNLLTDLPEMTIAADQVDPEMVERPRRWDIGFIRRFMVVFGAISSAFDAMTFGALLLVLRAGESELRTGWFIESVTSAALIVLVVRTSRPFYRSRPGRALTVATVGVIGLTLTLPYTPMAAPLGLAPLRPMIVAMLIPIVILYAATAEAAKVGFYRRTNPTKKPAPQMTSTADVSRMRDRLSDEPVDGRAGNGLPRCHERPIEMGSPE